MTTAINESIGTVARTAKPGRILLTVIRAGQGSSGYYPEETLQEAVEQKLFKKGTKIFGDHPTASEQAERPEGSISKMVGKLVEDAFWNPDEKAIQAEASIYPSVKDQIYERAEDIGASIRGNGDVDPDGTVTRLTKIRSVDLVTEAGAGGGIAELLESSRRQIVERNGGVLKEATANDRRRYLSDAVENAYREDGVMAFVEDYDDQYVYFRRTTIDPDQPHMAHTEELRQPYEIDGVNVTLGGNPEPVKPETSFTPTSPEPELTESATAGGTPVMEIQESEYQRLTASAERVPVLESEKNDAVQRAEQAEAKLAEARAENVEARATAILNESFQGVKAERTKARLLESAKADVDAFDADAFKSEADEIAAEITESAGGPKVQDFGYQTSELAESGGSDEVTDDAIVNILEGAR